MTAIDAPAKINLFLRICGKTAQGYHLLDSVTVFTDFGDRLTVTPAARDRLVFKGPFANFLDQPAVRGPDNLVMRALAAFRAGGGVLGPVEITLDKHIPVGAGLGGGSADAAALLRLANDLATVRLDPAHLVQIGAALGADVPVCLASRSQRVGGIGETLCDFPVAPAYMLLANPLKPLPTAKVFSAFRGPGLGSAGALGDDDAAALAGYGNDLLAAAGKIIPEIEPLLQAVRSAPGCRAAGMSGSGASCFGIFSDAEDTENAARRVHKMGFWAMPTKIKAEN